MYYNLFLVFLFKVYVYVFIFKLVVFWGEDWVCFIYGLKDVKCLMEVVCIGIKYFMIGK